MTLRAEKKPGLSWERSHKFKCITYQCDYFILEEFFLKQWVCGVFFVFLNQSCTCMFDSELLFLKAAGEGSMLKFHVKQKRVLRNVLKLHSQFESSRIVAEPCLPYSFRSQGVFKFKAGHQLCRTDFLA